VNHSQLCCWSSALAPQDQSLSTCRHRKLKLWLHTPKPHNFTVISSAIVNSTHATAHDFNVTAVQSTDIFVTSTILANVQWQKKNALLSSIQQESYYQIRSYFDNENTFQPKHFNQNTFLKIFRERNDTAQHHTAYYVGYAKVQIFRWRNTRVSLILNEKIRNRRQTTNIPLLSS